METNAITESFSVTLKAVTGDGTGVTPMTLLYASRYTNKRTSRKSMPTTPSFLVTKSVFLKQSE